MSKKSWLCRDMDKFYIVCPLAKRPVFEIGAWRQHNQRDTDITIPICPRRFEREFPNLKLKPGEGPRRVEFTGEFCDE